MTFQVVLRREGFVVLEASNASDALEQVRDSSPDLLITEMGLPQASGAKLIRTIRGDSDHPLLILALGDESARREAEAAGADSFQVTPTTPEQLVKAVTTLIGRA